MMVGISADGFVIGHIGGEMLSLVGAIRSPDFGAMTDFFFAMAWAYFAVMAAFGALMVYVGRSQLRSKAVVRVGAGVLVVVALWAVMAWVVVTPRERLEARHRELLDALAAKDMNRVMAVLGDDFRASPLAIDSDAAIRPAIESVLQAYPMRGSTITAMTERVDGISASTRVTIVTEFESFPVTKTTWVFSWLDAEGGDWRLYEARLELVNGASAGDLRIPGRI